LNNPLKYELSTKGSKTYLPENNNLNTNESMHEFEIFNKSLDSSNKYLNNTTSYTFEDVKSGNQALLPGERTVRLTDKLNPNKNLNTDDYMSGATSLQDVFASSQSTNTSYTDLNRFTGTQTTFPNTHNPVISLNTSVKDLSFDRTFIDNKAPALLSSKDESAPNIVFETY
jgi:hypothetical protein